MTYLLDWPLLDAPKWPTISVIPQLALRTC
jgi:hypothetical protein